MDKIFPSMHSKPEIRQIIAIIPCWIWVFVLVPMFMPFIALGIWEQSEYSVWLEIVYHVANGIIMLFIMSSYLKDEWFMVTTGIRYYLKHVLLTVGLIMGIEIVLLDALDFFGVNIGYMLEWLPVVEMAVIHTPLSVLDFQPVFGTIAMSIFTPISICALFYCLGFAPICYKKPWLAYLCIAVVTLIPSVIDILWRGDAALVLGAYFVALPVHLLACWSYQKTDNAWTPIVTLMITNILMSILNNIVLPIILFR